MKHLLIVLGLALLFNQQAQTSELDHEILRWCEDTTLSIDEALIESRVELVGHGNYRLAADVLAEEVRYLLRNSNIDLQHSYLAKILERVLLLHSSLANQSSDSRYEQIVFELLEGYLSQIKSIAFRLDQLRFGSVDISRIEEELLNFSRRQAEYILNFNITSISSFAVTVKDESIFFISSNLIALEVAGDIQESFVSERLSCAYRQAMRATREMNSPNIRIKIYRKYRVLKDLINRMNICH